MLDNYFEMGNTNRVKTLFYCIITLLVLTVCVCFLVKNSHIFLTFHKTSPLFLILFLIVTLLHIASNGYFSKIILTGFSVNLALGEWFLLPFVTSLINLVTPLRGGAAYRAWYLKKLYNLSYSLFMVQLGSSIVFSLIIGSLFGFTSSIYFVTQQQPFAGYFVAAFFLIAVITYGLTRSKISIAASSNILLKKLRVILNSWQMIHANTILVCKLALNILITYLLSFILIYLAYGSLQINISFMAVIFISITSSFLTLFNVTPGNLGIREGIITLCGMYSGIEMADAAAVSLLIRGVEIAVVTIIAGAGFLYLSNRVREKNERV
jgi:uncharacterized protein (TIRG00374 family)